MLYISYPLVKGFSYTAQALSNQWPDGGEGGGGGQANSKDLSINDTNGLTSITCTILGPGITGLNSNIITEQTNVHLMYVLGF